MCGCGLRPNLASTPARSIIRAKPAVVNGVSRSDVNTNGDFVTRAEPRSKSRHNAFDASLQPLGDKVASTPTSCISIGRAYEHYQNLTHSDAVYALARIVVQSGLQSDKAATCLGAVYGPDVAQDAYWKKNSGIVFPSGDGAWQPQNKLTYSQLRFDEITEVMTDYANGKGDKIAFDEFFSPQLNVTDLTHIVGNSQNLTADQLVDKLKSAKQYLYYGCPEADATVDDNGSPAVANLLAVDQSLGQDKILLIRTWWKLDRKDNARPRINALFLSTDSNTIAASLKDWTNVCSGKIIKPVKQ
jgi:hypothetical protein